MFVAKMYIPKGFVSDGGSIPRFFCRIFNPLDGRYLKYYIQHDFIYATGLRDRKSADILLRKGLEKARYEFSIQMAVYIFLLDYLVQNITKILKKMVNNYSVGFGTLFIIFYPIEFR